MAFGWNLDEFHQLQTSSLLLSLISYLPQEYQLNRVRAERKGVSTLHQNRIPFKGVHFKTTPRFIHDRRKRREVKKGTSQQQASQPFTLFVLFININIKIILYNV